LGKETKIMQMRESVPITEIVDFDEELETFERMVADKDEKRLMFIRAPGGRGKTCLLRRVAEHCRVEGIPYCRIDFRWESYEAPCVTLAREVCVQLSISPRRLAETLLPLIAYHTEGEARIEIRGDVTDSQIITQVLTKASATIIEEALHQDHVKRRLRRAFTADLSTAEGLLVCFLDSFEDVSDEEEAWLLDALLHPVREGELEDVIVVTAGRRWPTIEDWEWEEDAHLIDGLPTMSIENIMMYAEKVGYRITEEEAHFCWRACRGGIPIHMGVVVKNLRAMGEVGR
jgi:hypothetical protein